MKVYRICSRKNSKDISGIGAALYGGRWNKKGVPVLYTGASKEIALLETMVHTPPLLIPKLDLLTIEIPDNSISEVTIDDLPENWTSYPAPALLAEIAHKWIVEGKSIALKVPSCIIHSSHNYILNCGHSEYSSVVIESIEPFYFDTRLNS